MRPLRGGAAGVLIVFSILLGISAKSLFGLPLTLILLSWFYKYAFILFDSTVRGFDEPPVLDINMMNPYSEFRPVAMLLIASGMVIATWALYIHSGPSAAYVLGSVFILVLPACIATLALERNPILAINPVAIFRMIHGLGAYYCISLVIIATEVAAIRLLGALPLGSIFQFATAMFGTLSAFSLLAGALYERRDQMGLIAWVSPERHEEVLRREDHRQDEQTVTEAFGLMRATRHRECWHRLQAWLATKNFESNSYSWLIGQTDLWGDGRYSHRLTEDCVERLLAQKSPGEALSFTINRLRIDSAFRPKSSADTLALAQLAARGGGSRRTARLLLSDFSMRFPDDPRVPVAERLSAHLR